MEKFLENAIALAVEKHRGQRDKAGAPYILHPLRVMLRVGSLEAKMAAVLHDVVEDTGVTLEALAAAGYPARVVEAVGALSRRPGESYEAFIARAGQCPLAREVKLADLEDNMNLGRFPQVTERDLARNRKYRAAWERLAAVGRK